ncbi:Calreticulin [Hypsibius exemplaris]|uniref:Calreticulin n=1 Tax=Hypsibius exemplaris TaxID=2072580 RepID=A0A1W0X3H2_HYPEX|nr:Calreticulin [Hypsibius exemplaris]
MIIHLSALVACLSLSLVTAKIYFEESFDDPSWEERWIRTTRQEFRGKPFGYFNWTAGKYSADPTDKGIRTMDKESHYAISRKFPRFNNKDKTLVIQFTLKYEIKLELGDAGHCAALFIKLLPSSHNPKYYDPEAKYLMKFGPDSCSSAHKIESDIYYRGRNWAFSRRADHDRAVFVYMPYPFFPDDAYTHLYTFVIHPNNTFEKRFDGKIIVEDSGHFEQCWQQIHPTRQLHVNYSDERPEDWDEREFILDPTETKPLDWDQPKEIPDPHASQPDDWDTVADGQWEHPLIINPDYKGEWQPTRVIPNPDHKGRWSHKMMDNPKYVEDPEMYLVKDIGAIGIEGWHEQPGTVLDNILITDDLELALARGVPWQARAHAAEIEAWGKVCEAERLERVKEFERMKKDRQKMKNIIKNQAKRHHHDEL